MLDREEYISHINDPEQIINMRRILDKIDIVMTNHMVESTDFLNPYERKLARSILNRFIDIDYREVGGLDDSERQIIVIYPDYHYLTEDDYDLEALKISDYISEFSHRDILGSLMGLGIVREKVGDILVNDEETHIVVKKEISDYVFYNLEKIGRENVKVEKISLTDIKKGKLLYNEKTNTVASLRLDAIISMALNIPRSSAQKLVDGERVRVNWEPVNRVFLDLEEGDLISIKGFGRFILHSIGGKSRKDRIRITIRILK